MVEFEVGNTFVVAETKPDLFSPKGLDMGTKLLLEVLAKQKYKTLLDWGCGWGAIGLWAAKNNPKAQVVAIDSDIGAVKVAQQNADANRLSNLEVLASYSFDELDENAKFDVIASNLPTHRGREIVENMILQSKDRLIPGGKLVIVVEARLKPWVAKQMSAVFGNHKIAKRGPKNVVLVGTL